MDSTSAIGGVFADDAGTLWVQRWASPYAGADTLTLDAIDATGTWVRTIQLPPNAGRILDIAFGRIISVWYDEMRVPHVKVFDLPPSVHPGP